MLESVELLGGSQTITIPIDVVRAGSGKIDGILDVTLEDPTGVNVSLQPVAFVVEIPEPPTALAALTPEKRKKLIAAGGIVLGLLICLLILVRKNRRPVHRMVRFTPPPEPRADAAVVDEPNMFEFEDELHR